VRPRRAYVLYKRLGETQWTVRHGWIPTDDSLRQYLSTLLGCVEFYIVKSEPLNNAVLLFSEVQEDFRNHENDKTATPAQLGRRKAVIKQLPRRNNKARLTEEDKAEAELRRPASTSRTNRISLAFGTTSLQELP
jgi:hypothetical protein